MKLRNKRTRELANCEPIEVKTDAGFHDYYSLAELNEGWEDYEPKEPLIENREIREIIRAWAKVNGATELKYYDGENCLEDIFRNEIHFNQALGLEDGNSYTIAELCEEWEDYKPKEPLIKNEKVRKAVRAWAEAFNVDVAYLAPIGDGSKFVELFNEDSDGFERIAIPADNIKQEQCYTIAELCGEEEAPEPIEPTFIDLDERIKEKEKE